MSGKATGPSALYLLFLFVLWYAFNAGYNVYNSLLKSPFPLPITIALLQLPAGLIYVIPLWILGIRKTPNLSIGDIFKLLPIVLLNAAGHAAAVIAMFQIGGGSFTHVIKASEPVASVILGLLVSGVVPKPLTFLSLLPITYGVAYASTLGNLDVNTMARELTTKAAIFAFICNVAFALRSILRKNLTSEFKNRTNLDPANEHAITTILSALLLTPAAYIYETPATILATYNAISDQQLFLTNLFICGMCFYVYNELQNMVLGSLGPVPTAVGNTLKRVVIFVALYFCTEGETFPLPKIVGCAIAIGGCLLFAIFDSWKI